MTAGALLSTSNPTDTNGFTWFDADIPIRGEAFATGNAVPEDGVWTADYNSGLYKIVEVTPPKGYLLDDAPLSVSFTYAGQFTAWQVVDAVQKNLQTTAYFSKQDLTNGAELPGATLEIFDSNNESVLSWVSSEKPYTVRGLELDKEYTLREIKPAAGYAMAEDIVFKLIQPVTDEGNLIQRNDVYWKDLDGIWQLLDEQTVTMKDDTIKVNISKTDIVSGEELPGAELVIKDKSGTEIESWTSTSEPHYIEKLPAGEYILTEKTAPDGYAVAEDVSFTILPTGEIQSVIMKDAPKLTIKKTDVGGHNLPGATMTVRDSNQSTIDTWVTTDAEHIMPITKADDTLPNSILISDEQNEYVYTLIEDAAPAGYEIATSIVFKVAMDEANAPCVYIRPQQDADWVLVDGRTLTMIDADSPVPSATPEPTPPPTPDTPAPTPIPERPVSTPTAPPQRFWFVPQTGDNSKPLLFVALAGVSLVALITLAVVAKKKKEGTDDSEDDTSDTADT